MGLLSPADGQLVDPDRPETLDLLLGDPADSANPTGWSAFAAADRHGELLSAAERVLDIAGLGRQFVPHDVGGDLGDIARLGRLLRPVFRRDGAVALGHGASNLVGSVNVWLDGSDAQRAWLGHVLCANGRVAAAYTEPKTGNDVIAGDFIAEPTPSGYALTGRKAVINNLERADAITVLARTDGSAASRSQSLFLVRRDDLDLGRVAFHPRYPTAGVRALQLGGMDLTACPVPRDSLVGRSGAALETMLRAFQVTRSVLPSAALGGVDAALRVAVHFALRRHLYGQTIAELGHVQSVLCRAWVDLLIADALATMACRSLHLAPQASDIYAAATKSLVPVLMRASMNGIATVLGARSFLAGGPEGIVEKQLRDLPVVALVHGGGPVCRATVIPQLHRLARRSWAERGSSAPAGYAVIAAALPALEWTSLRVVGTGADPLVGLLNTHRRDLPSKRAVAAAEQICGALDRLSVEAAGLPTRDIRDGGSARAFELVDRYALILAASACAGVWAQGQGTGLTLLADGVWLEAAMEVIASRLRLGNDRGVGSPRHLWPQLVATVAHQRALDLGGLPVGSTTDSRSR